MVWRGRGAVHCVTCLQRAPEKLRAPGAAEWNRPRALSGGRWAQPGLPGMARGSSTTLWLRTPGCAAARTHARGFGNVTGNMAFHASAAYPTCPSSFYPSALPVSLCAGRQSEALRCIYFLFLYASCCCSYY